MPNHHNGLAAGSRHLRGKSWRCAANETQHQTPGKESLQQSQVSQALSPYVK